MKATREDLRRWYNSFENCVTGYACEYNAPCGKYALRELGYNSGVYGWNWTAYADYENDTLYISYYRNVPAYIKDKRAENVVAFENNDAA